MMSVITQSQRMSYSAGRGPPPQDKKTKWNITFYRGFLLPLHPPTYPRRALRTTTPARYHPQRKSIPYQLKFCRVSTSKLARFHNFKILMDSMKRREICSRLRLFTFQLNFWLKANFALGYWCCDGSMGHSFMNNRTLGGEGRRGRSDGGSRGGSYL